MRLIVCRHFNGVIKVEKCLKLFPTIHREQLSAPTITLPHIRARGSIYFPLVALFKIVGEFKVHHKFADINSMSKLEMDCNKIYAARTRWRRPGGVLMCSPRGETGITSIRSTLDLFHICQWPASGGRSSHNDSPLYIHYILLRQELFS